MEKRKISNHQTAALVAMHTCGSSMLVIAATATGLAGQDVWISALIAIVLGLLYIWMILYLCGLYPGRTYVEITRLLLGKWVGTAVIAGFIFFCFTSVTQLVGYINDFTRIQFLPETPSYAVSIVMVIGLVIALLYGLESVARASELFIVVISVIFLSAMGLVIPNADVNRLLPALEKGLGPALKGALFIISYLAWPVIVLGNVFFSKTANTKETKKSIFKGYLWGTMLVFIAVLMSSLVLGSKLAASTVYPTFFLAQEVNIENVLSGAEGIVAGVWLITVFFKTIMYFYGAVTGLSFLISLKDYRKIVLPLGLIVLVFSGIIYPNSFYEAKWDTTTWIPYVFTFAIFVPGILLVIHAIKKWSGTKPYLSEKRMVPIDERKD